MDVDNAFYRIATPEGLREHFVLPSVDLDTLRVERPDLASQMMGLQRAVSSMAASAASSVRMAVTQSPPSPRDPGPGHHAAHMHMAGAGYGFQHHNL